MSIARVWFWLSAGAFVFISGMAVGHYQVFPYQLFKSARDSVALVWTERDNLFGTRPVHFLEKARHDGDGARLVQPSKAYPGLTLITGFFGESSALRLIRPDGTLVAEWPVKYFDIFPDPSHIHPADRAPATNWNIDIHGAIALPDGSVAFNFEFGGFAKLDRCGKVLWTVPRMTHHSVEQASDGGFWVPARRYQDGTSKVPGVSPPYFYDTILKISAAGVVENEISVADVLIENGLLPLVLANDPPELFGEVRELGHLNDIEELPASIADRFPGFEAGDLLISLRDLSLVLVFNPDSRKVKWHRTGPWLRQHDPDFEPDGTISVFNNNPIPGVGAELGTRRSSIMSADPTSGTTRLLFGDNPEVPMFTSIRGKHQILPNGNILMVEFAAGRILEVDASGELVWEYVNRYDAETVAEVGQATRYSEQFFTPETWSCQ